MTLDEKATLIHRRSETAHVDYKAGLEWNKENRDHQLELIRDMIAMANTPAGGTLILGVEDGNSNCSSHFSPADAPRVLKGPWRRSMFNIV
jgi:predicted HTH transcriptional regulator